MPTISYAHISESIAAIRAQVDMNPKIAIVLGTGMNVLANCIMDAVYISYQDIPHFPVSTVTSHQGMLIFGKLNGVEVLLVSGRFHYYEGYDMEQVTYYIHVLKELGIAISILTSASGGLNPHYKEGELVVIEDHINLFPQNPLRGPNDEIMGHRFPDLLHAYHIGLRNVAHSHAERLGISLKSGIYLGWQGPSLETPAEYKMAHLLGADLVGMSTIPEVIVNRYRGIDTLAFTIVSNVCFPSSCIKETTIESVIDTVHHNAIKLQKLIISILPELDQP